MPKVYTKLTEEQRRQLYELGYQLYEEKGQHAVENLGDLFDLPLAPCRECEVETPQIDGMCFVCSSPCRPDGEARHEGLDILCESTGLPANEMEFLGGQDTGVGIDYYLLHTPSGREFYLNNDQGFWTFSECI